MRVILLFIWFCLTVILCLSVIGIFILAENDDKAKSTWMTIGINLCNSITNES